MEAEHASTPVTDAEQWSDDTEQSSETSPEQEGYIPLGQYQDLGDTDDGDLSEGNEENGAGGQEALESHSQAWRQAEGSADEGLEEERERGADVSSTGREHKMRCV